MASMVPCVFILLVLTATTSRVKQLQTVIREHGRSGDQKAGSTSAQCFCREGRCNPNEKGITERAMEVRRDDKESHLCCKFIDGTLEGDDRRTIAEWKIYEDKYCISIHAEEIKMEIEKLQPEEGRSKQECQGQVKAFTETIETLMEQKHNDFLHGTHNRHIHIAQAAEEVAYELLKGDNVFRTGTMGAHFFQHLQNVKLLWCEIHAERRKKWKAALGAGELSRGTDTLFAQVVDDKKVGQLRNCSYNKSPAIQKVWRVASASYAGLAPEKDLVIIIGKNNEDELKATMMWRAELHGVAINPPKGKVSVISLGQFTCGKLMKLLKGKIESEITPNGNTSKNATETWGKKTNFACREADPDKPDNTIGSSYMPPFGERSLGITYWEELAQNGGGRVFSEMYTKSDCVKVLVSLEPSLCEDFRHFKTHLKFESDDKALKELVSYCPELTSIKLDVPEHQKGVTDAGIEELVAKAANLQSISLQRTSLTGVGLKEMARKLNRLSTIDFRDATFTDIDPKEFAYGFNSLKKIGLYGTNVDDTSLKELANNCANLKELSLGRTKVTDNGVKEIFKGCPQLEKINLAWTTISYKSMKELDSNCASLKEIDLSHCANVNDEAVKELARNCGGVNLLTANLTGTRLSDEGYKELASNVPPATAKIDLSRQNIGDKTIKELARNCEGLNLLTANVKGTQVSDEGYKELAKNVPVETTSIDLRGDNIGDKTITELVRNCKGINLLTAKFDEGRVSDIGYKELARNVPPDTTSIDLRGKEIGDQTIKELAFRCKGIHLLTAKFDAFRVSDVGLKELAKNMPRDIESIDLTDVNVGDATIEELAFTCRGLNLLTAKFEDSVSLSVDNLKKFDEGVEPGALYRMVTVSDDAYKDLAKNMPRDLTSVDLSGKRIGDKTIKELTTRCKKLKKIYLSQTGVTTQGIEELIQNCPKLTQSTEDLRRQIQTEYWEPKFLPLSLTTQNPLERCTEQVAAYLDRYAVRVGVAARMLTPTVIHEALHNTERALSNAREQFRAAVQDFKFKLYIDGTCSFPSEKLGDGLIGLPGHEYTLNDNRYLTALDIAWNRSLESYPTVKYVTLNKTLGYTAWSNCSKALRGRWLYNDGNSAYELIEGDNHYIFKQFAGGKLYEKTLRLIDGWWQSNFEVRFQLDDRGNLISETKRTVEDEWGDRQVAVKESAESHSIARTWKRIVPTTTQDKIAALPASACPGGVGFITDIEGDLDWFQYIVGISKTLEWSGDPTDGMPGKHLALKDGACFVFGGDLFDRGPGDIRSFRTHRSQGVKAVSEKVLHRQLLLFGKIVNLTH